MLQSFFMSLFKPFFKSFFMSLLKPFFKSFFMSLFVSFFIPFFFPEPTGTAVVSTLCAHCVPELVVTFQLGWSIR